MDYSKWRKILIILMVFSLSINLLSKFSKSFGAYEIGEVPVPNSSYRTFTLPDWITDNYNYFFAFTPYHPGNNANVTAYMYSLYISQNPMYISSANGVTISGTNIYRFLVDGFQYSGLNSSVVNQVNNMFNTIENSTSLDSLSDYQKTPVSSSIIFTASTMNYSTFLTKVTYTSNFDMKNGNTVVFPSNITKYPEIANSLTSLETLDFDVISINAWDWSNKEFDVLFYDRNIKDTSSTEGLYPKRVITLNKDSSYYQADLTADPSKNAIYWIPIDEIGLNLYVGGNYEIRLAERVPLNPSVSGADYYYNYLGNFVTFTVSSDVSQDKINAINKEIEDTTNKKYHDETINSINNINNNINNVNNALTNTTLDSSISSDIDNSLDFDNQNETLNNLNSGFFTRLTSMLSNLLGYNLADDTSVSIPFPNSDKFLVLHSKDIYDNVIGSLRLIINAFWVYIFSFYLWKFINKIYISVSSGNILDSFSSNGEAITNDML